MKITETKVQTFYTLNLDAADFALILERLNEDKEMDRALAILHPKAFDWVTISNDMTESEAVGVMEQMLCRANGDTYTYIAKYYGYDGWHSAGYYNNRKRTYTMVVYNNGDTLNFN